TVLSARALIVRLVGVRQSSGISRESWLPAAALQRVRACEKRTVANTDTDGHGKPPVSGKRFSGFSGLGLGVPILLHVKAGPTFTGLEKICLGRPRLPRAG